VGSFFRWLDLVDDYQSNLRNTINFFRFADFEHDDFVVTKKISRIDNRVKTLVSCALFVLEVICHLQGSSRLLFHHICNSNRHACNQFNLIVESSINQDINHQEDMAP